MRNSILLIILVISPLFNFTFCQNQIQRDTGINLVPNPSFEQLRNKNPDFNAEPYIAYRNYMSKWASPTKTTPDLVYSIYDDKSDEARTGEKMIGFLTHNPISKRSDTWREYVQVKLNKTLIENKEYVIEFWVKRHKQANMASNNIGALLGKAPIVEKNYEPITDMELVVNQTEIINPNEPKWVKISSNFIAQGGEKFLLIGNFYNNENTKFKAVKNLNEPAWENPYYLLDDVSIREIIVEEPEPIIAEVEEPVFEDVKIKKGQVIRLDRIYFDFDKFDLLPESDEQLAQLVTLLNNYPSLKIAVHGHTDSRGSEVYNETLSHQRSKAVHDFLLNNNIDYSRLEFRGFGEMQPVDTNDTEEGRQYNRRVEFVVLEINEENVEVENVAHSGEEN